MNSNDECISIEINCGDRTFPQQKSATDKPTCEACHSTCKSCTGSSESECEQCNGDGILMSGKCFQYENLDKKLQSGFDTTKDENGEYQEICGKGWRVSNKIQCDDGNLKDGDGCSKTCQVEEGFVCSGGTSTSPDLCISNQPLTFKIKSIYDSDYEFRLEFSQILDPKVISSINSPDNLEEYFEISTDKLNS